MGMVQAEGAFSFVVFFQFSWIHLLMFFQLGANAILAVSLAVCKAGAAVKKVPLYQVRFQCDFLQLKFTILELLVSLTFAF